MYAEENTNNNANMQFCADCGNSYSRRATNCPKCGCPSPLATPVANGEQKSRTVYILLAFFLGGLGIHNFYSGHAGRGIAKILMTITFILSPISCIWALIELCTVKADVNGVPFN